MIIIIIFSLFVFLHLSFFVVLDLMPSYTNVFFGSLSWRTHRSMCVRGGLSEDHAPMHPLDMENVRVLEVRFVASFCSPAVARGT